MFETAFSILQLGPSYDLNLQKLEENYYALQKAFHPDMYINCLPQERLLAAQRIALINKAYHTLKTPLGRAQEMLKGLMEKDPNDQGAISLNPTLLNDIMVYQEQIEELAQKDDIVSFLATLHLCIQQQEAIFLEKDQSLEALQQAFMALKYFTKLQQLAEEKLQA